ncbi:MULTISPECIES: hypothetical protein [Pseudonocardia]|uniref:Transmembrane protein n=2 Tax=Pseudonocardia TaxID=1847 RepID=A0A1Y2N4W9_PSEAH|nr:MULTISPECIES: hypothetical protein [Pseudonocardia]OSY42520.1 hypothetical protein BG845_01440 [Pseudonocardia autotrophica]TDN76039.1 hypothetical protein C8E95_5225 [Pseudonocardia autotrophica]BBG00016.1 hypothetical protein Pdca_12250 [Pseudonocardia autotrophica]GEC28058.1 hypothetical protein PSA01_50870 [Pseudonocardia saturnea]
MENESAARDALRDLETDRSALAGRIAAPAWLHAAFGLVAAAYVLMPAFGETARVQSVWGLAVVVLVLLWVHRRFTGIRPRAVGGRAWAVCGLTVVAVLLLLSVSLGLVASLSPWWAVAPAVVCFGVVWWANVAFERLTREKLRRGH